MEQKDIPEVTYSLGQRKFLRIYDAFLAGAVVIAAAVILYAIPYGSLYYGNRSEGDIGTIITLMIVVGVLALFIASAFTFLSPKETKEGDALPPMKFPFRLSLMAVAATWIMTFPWAFIHLPDESPLLIALLAVPLMLCLGLLFGALAWLFVVVPLNMLVVSLYMLIAKRDTTASIGMILGVMLLSFGALIIVMPMAVDTSHTGPAGYPSMIAAMAGLPGDYEVKNESLHLVGRILAVVAALSIVAYLIVGNRIRKAISPEEQKQPQADETKQ